MKALEAMQRAARVSCQMGKETCDNKVQRTSAVQEYNSGVYASVLQINVLLESLFF